MKILMETVHHVARAKFITICDAKAGFWQIKVSEKDIWKTTFVTHHGVWEWTRMPFGLKGAPGTFVRGIRQILRPIRKHSDAYVDDMYVTTETDFGEHLEHFREFLVTIKNAGLTLNLKKRQFAQSRVALVGYLVGNGRYEADSSKSEAISRIKIPVTKTELRSVIGTLSFYRGLIEGFAEIAKPLTDLIGKHSPVILKWSLVEQKVFETLRDKVCSSPVLAPPKCGQPFVLYTDSSQYYRCWTFETGNCNFSV